MQKNVYRLKYKFTNLVFEVFISIKFFILHQQYKKSLLYLKKSTQFGTVVKIFQVSMTLTSPSIEFPNKGIHSLLKKSQELNGTGLIVGSRA